MNTAPAEQIRTYSTVPSKASAGACISTASWGAASSSAAVATTATTRNRQMPLPTACPASSGLPSPIFWPSSTVMPMARPVMTMVTVCMIWLPVETAEISAAVPNFPTTCRSTAPYMACSSRASSTGRANFSRVDRIGPRVKLCSVVSINSSQTLEGSKKSRIRVRAPPASYPAL